MASIQIPVPAARTRRPEMTSRGLVDDVAYQVKLGARQLFSCDWFYDQAMGGRIANFDGAQRIDVNPGDGNATIEIGGTDRQETKFWMTGTVAGKFSLQLLATDREGHEAEAHLMVNVT